MKLDMLHQRCKPIIIRSNSGPGLALTYFTPRSNLVAQAFMWKKVKIIYFSETIAVYDIKVGRCTELNNFMKLHEYQV